MMMAGINGKREASTGHYLKSRGFFDPRRGLAATDEWVFEIDFAVTQQVAAAARVFE